MKLSTRGRYGLRMLIDLSMQKENIVTLSSIAHRQDVSPNYLEQVARDLKRARYIRSIKGPHGGYVLAIQPQDIKIGNLLRLLEGDIRLTDKYLGEESILQQCIRENVYDVLNKSIAEFFDSITLNDLILTNHKY